MYEKHNNVSNQQITAKQSKNIKQMENEKHWHILSHCIYAIQKKLMNQLLDEKQRVDMRYIPIENHEDVSSHLSFEKHSVNSSQCNIE